MHVLVLGPGRIGGNVARRLATAGHRITLAYSRDAQRLAVLATDIGVTAGTPGDAADADVVVLAVPWSFIDDALAACGDLTGRIVIDTTNQFADGGLIDLGEPTAARHNADRMPGARYTKSFNTLTAAFQAEVPDRPEADKVVQWICGDDTDAKGVVAGLVRDAGYLPVDLGGIDGCLAMEAPRRPGAVYGEEYRAADAAEVVAALAANRPIPPTPSYS